MAPPQAEPAQQAHERRDARAEMLNERPQVRQMKTASEKLGEGRANIPTPEPVQKRANRTGLPDRLKAGVESLSGLAMDDVRVHRNSAKPERLQALAYAQGNDIHLGPGQEEHLPHEAWHVVQQKQGRVKPTLQLKGGVALNDETRLEREADAMGALALRTIGGAERQFPTPSRPTGLLPVQRTKFEFEGHVLDPDDTGAFTDWCKTMARVNPERARDLIPFLLDRAPIDGSDRRLELFEILRQALGNPLPAVDPTIGAGYQNVEAALDGYVVDGHQIARVDTWKRTIRAAALIDANADLIAQYGPQARIKIRQIAGEQPETGFVNETGEAIRNRAKAVLAAWANAENKDGESATPSDQARLALFRDGLAGGACLCARLNAITEFQAVQEGIPASALEDAPYDIGLSQQIYGIISDKETDYMDADGNYDRAAFRAFYVAAYPVEAADFRFEASYAAAWNAYAPG